MSTKQLLTTTAPRARDRGRDGRGAAPAGAPRYDVACASAWAPARPPVPARSLVGSRVPRGAGDPPVASPRVRRAGNRAPAASGVAVPAVGRCNARGPRYQPSAHRAELRGRAPPPIRDRGRSTIRCRPESAQPALSPAGRWRAIYRPSQHARNGAVGFARVLSGEFQPG